MEYSVVNPFVACNRACIIPLPIKSPHNVFFPICHLNFDSSTDLYLQPCNHKFHLYWLLLYIVLGLGECISETMGPNNVCHTLYFHNR